MEHAWACAGSGAGAGKVAGTGASLRPKDLQQLDIVVDSHPIPEEHS